MPTYNQHNTLVYNLMQNSRKVGDTSSISREQLGRSNFTRDQMIAANIIGIGKSKLVLEAARGSSRLRNLHPQMDNTNVTGGFGGLGYASGKNNTPTADYALPSDGNAIAHLLSLGKISHDNYLTVSQYVSKPHVGIYSRFAELQGVEGFIRQGKDHEHFDPDERFSLVGGPEEAPFTFGEFGYKILTLPKVNFIDSFLHIDLTADTTTVQAMSSVIGGSHKTQIVLPVRLDPNVTYWYAHLYNQNTNEKELFAIAYSDCDMEFFDRGKIVNNYPNMPLSRTLTFDQNHFDTYKGDIQVYPTDAEREAYLEANQPTLDSLSASIAEQLVIKDAARLEIDTTLINLTGLSDEEQDLITYTYINEVLPALEFLGLDPATYTQEELDLLNIIGTEEWIYVNEIEDAHLDLTVSLPESIPIDTMHDFSAIIPQLIIEEAAVTQIGILSVQKTAIERNAPFSEHINNDNYSEWGEWTFFKDYRDDWSGLFETFLSEGNPNHDAVIRFLSMIGQTPRAISDAIRYSAQDDPESGGDSHTLCDQLFLGCQATENMDYAEMRYMIEFARAAWWTTAFDSNTTIDSRTNGDIYSDLGMSAWGIQHIEETPVNPGYDSMRNMRTRWGKCKVWIQAGQVDDGAFGTITMTQTTKDGKGKSGLDHHHESDSNVISDESGVQKIVGSYQIDNGYILRIEIEDLITLAYSKVGFGSRHSTNSYINYPIVPMFYNVMRSIPQSQVCQISNEFTFIRSHTHWLEHRSSWVEFRDGTLYQLVGAVIAVVGLILAIPSGGLTLSWTVVGTGLLYAAAYYAAMRVVAYLVEEFGLGKTWIGAIIVAVMTIVAIYYGMPPQDAALLSTTITADGMAFAYNKVNLEEAKAAAGLMSTYDDTIADVVESIEDMQEQQQWLDFYSAQDLVKLRQDAVDYVRKESPDQYYGRMMGYHSNMLNLDGLDYLYDHDLDLELT